MKILRVALLTIIAVMATVSVCAQTPKILHAEGSSPIGWDEFFLDFPAVKMGMSLKAARKAIVKSGVRPVGMPGNVAEVVWNTTFAGIEGRATMLFKPKTGAWEVAVVVYAMERRTEVLKSWRDKIELRNGPPTEIHDDEYAISYVWRFKSGDALELRSPKDVNSPVVDIHWVKLDGRK